MQKIERQRHSEMEWREIVERQERSGLTVGQFCEAEGLNANSLYGWRSRLRGDSEESVPSEGLPKKRRTRRSEGFIDLGPLARGSRFEVRLDLGGGVLLHLVRS
ncbi:MAG TPA: transposase [Candidatus Binataceae bacterium]|nr:transposase [Candidatus Binataceae bacterium]